MDSKEDAGSLVGNVGLKFLTSLVFFYDFVTYPFYYALQQPWIARSAAAEILAIPISKSESEVTYKAKSKTSSGLERFNQAGIETMMDCWDFAVGNNSHKDCLGTREVLEEKDEKQPDGKIFKKWRMGEYKWKNYLEVDELANNFGKGLRELGLKHKENVCIFAESKADWMVCALGCFKQTFPLVTLYANLGEDAICHGVNQTQVQHLITTHDLLPKIKKVLHRTPSVKYVIYLEDQLNPTDTSGFKEGVGILSLSEVINMGSKSNAIGIKPKPLDPAIIMYTSGSTGVPKGVILPHESLISTIKAFHLVVNDPKPYDIYLGYLPLAHIYELLAEMTMLVQGIKVGYSSPNTMIDKSTKVMRGSTGDCSKLKPTLMCAVPLVLDRIYKGIQDNVTKKGPFMKALLHFCYKYKSYYRQMGMQTPILDSIIFKSMKDIVGGRIRVVVSGGAPLLPETHDYVSCVLNVPIHQGYGLTESCACGTVMQRQELSAGRVGPPGQGVLIKLVNWEEGNYHVTDKPNPRGEIIIGGSNIGLGYYKLPDKTKEDFYTDENGLRWFKTGDIGEFSLDGTLKIIDRKKDLVKLQYGEYVSLGKVETVLKTCPLVENVCAYGDPNQSYCVALVVPDRNKLTELADKKLEITGKQFEELCSDIKVVSAMLKEIGTFGRSNGLEKFEVPGAITLCIETWTPESGLVTPAFKLKRKPIQEFYLKDLKKMYT